MMIITSLFKTMQRAICVTAFNRIVLFGGPLSNWVPENSRLGHQQLQLTLGFRQLRQAPSLVVKPVVGTFQFSGAHGLYQWTRTSSKLLRGATFVHTKSCLGLSSYTDIRDYIMAIGNKINVAEKDLANGLQVNTANH